MTHTERVEILSPRVDFDDDVVEIVSDAISCGGYEDSCRRRCTEVIRQTASEYELLQM